MLVILVKMLALVLPSVHLSLEYVRTTVAFSQLKHHVVLEEVLEISKYLS